MEHHSEFRSEEREALVAALCAFFGRAEQYGGVLLLGGPRGVGKSRLVDHAINLRPKWHDFDKLRFALGATSRLRRVASRGPRREQRLLLRVDVDPYVSAPGLPAPPDEPRAGLASRSENLANFVLKNIALALSSTTSVGRSWRFGGRTIASRLGLLDYWFSRTSLTNCQGPGPVGAVLFGLFALCASGLWLATGDASYAVIAAAGALLVGWLVLRWRDLRALQTFSDFLYELVHSQALTQDSQSGHGQWSIALARSARGLSIAALLAVIGWWAGSALAPSNAAGEVPGVPLALARESGWWLPWIGAVLGAGVSLTFTTTSAWAAHRARFTEENPAWLVTLLRQYLFVLHRCGIEPVLVFDELDKLMSEPTADPSEKAQHRATLDELLDTLGRIREGVGAGFLVVLVGDLELPMKARHKRRDSLQRGLAMASIGTLIHQELGMGPVAPNTAVGFLLQGASGSEAAVKRVWAKATWVRARGLYANLARLSGAGMDWSDTQCLIAASLATEVQALWDLNALARVHLGLEDSDPAVADRMAAYVSRLEDPLTQVCVRVGMAQLAHELVDRGPEPLLHSDVEGKLHDELGEHTSEQDEKAALTIGEATVLRLLGRWLLYRHLRDMHDQDKSVGIPPPDAARLHRAPIETLFGRADKRPLEGQRDTEAHSRAAGAQEPS